MSQKNPRERARYESKKFGRSILREILSANFVFGEHAYTTLVYGAESSSKRAEERRESTNNRNIEIIAALVRVTSAKNPLIQRTARGAFSPRPSHRSKKATENRSMRSYENHSCNNKCPYGYFHKIVSIPFFCRLCLQIYMYNGVKRRPVYDIGASHLQSILHRPSSKIIGVRMCKRIFVN